MRSVDLIVLTGTEQDLCTSPLMCTEQAPHCAMPHPYLVPVRPTCSRITHSSGVFGSTSTCCVLPLMLRRIMRGFLPWWSGRVYCRPPAAAPQAVSLRRAESGDVIGERVDVAIREALRRL